MERTDAKKHVAIIEKCLMSEEGLRYLLSTPATGKYHFHFFRDRQAFNDAMRKTAFFSVIYSLSGLRALRRECLTCLHMLSIAHPHIQRIVLAGDDREAGLVSRLYPAEMHGIVTKTDTLPELLSQLVTLLGETRRVNDNIINHWHVSHSRMLSPTERAILHHMTRGLSMPDIAIVLDRNVKTIRAHKFNAMVKLGLNSEVALLHAADLLLWLPVAAMMQKKDAARAKR